MANAIARDGRLLLERILETPDAALVVPSLQPELLHRVIQRCGLEDSGELLALATPEQLTRVLDLDLWSKGRPGSDEAFDAGRFGVWLEVLAEAGASVAAEKLAKMDAALVSAGISQHVSVFDRGAVAPYETTDGDVVTPHPGVNDGLTTDIGGYVVAAKRTSSWDAIVAVLAALAAAHQQSFQQIMIGCRKLSDAGYELDGLDDLLGNAEQIMFNVGFERELRRGKEGYATPAQARAFLEISRQRVSRSNAGAIDPVTRAYFQAIENVVSADVSGVRLGRPALRASEQPGAVAVDAAGVLDVLAGAGILGEQPRGLLHEPQGDGPRLERIQSHMQFLLERNHPSYAARRAELAYLTNTLMAGASLQARSFTAEEASNATVATCNLGLEHLGASLPDDYLVGHDLVGVFQAGWRALQKDVSTYVAKQLVAILSGLECVDRETQAGLRSLRIQLARQTRAGTPWLAQEALEVIAILDTPAWMTLVGLLGECPVIHASIGASRGVRPETISASAFQFISDSSQISEIREFMESLPERLAS